MEGGRGLPRGMLHPQIGEPHLNFLVLGRRNSESPGAICALLSISPDGSPYPARRPEEFVDREYQERGALPRQTKENRKRRAQRGRLCVRKES